MIENYALEEIPKKTRKPDTRVESQLENSGWTKPLPRPPPLRFSAPIRVSAEEISPLTSAPTSQRLGDTSMLTELEPSRSSRCQCSSDSSPPTNTSNSSNQSEKSMKYEKIFLRIEK